jgi:hypothetical protein
MNSNKVSAGSKIMTKADQISFERTAPNAALGLVAAALLIVLGIVLQLDMLGYGHFNADGYWFISVIAEGIWNLLAARLDMPSMDVLLRFWPLLIVSSGLMILLALRPSHLARASIESRTEGSQDA